MKFTAIIGLNLRQIGAKKLVLLTNVQASDSTKFERLHCHAEVNANLHKVMDRNVRNNRNRLLIEFEADIVKYFKPRENCYSETLAKVRQIKILGRA